jgi:hypothetical protein
VFKSARRDRAGPLQEPHVARRKEAHVAPFESLPLVGSGFAACPSKKPGDRGGMNIEEPSGICSGLLTLRDHLHHLCPLLRQQLRPAPSNAALVASGFKARPRSLSQHGSLKLCKRSDHLHHHPARWRCGVDLLCKTAKTGLRFLNTLHDRSASGRRACPPSNLRNQASSEINHPSAACGIEHGNSVTNKRRKCRGGESVYAQIAAESWH